MQRAERGMTLLEVMAAVAILGLVYTYLASAATQGVRSEGDVRRRLEASLLADQKLAEIETELATGVAPATGTWETESDDFLVVVQVTPFELPAELAAAPAAELTDAPSVFAAGSAGTPNLVRRISVRVSWEDRLEKRSVERVTFGLDLEGVQALSDDVAGAVEATR